MILMTLTESKLLSQLVLANLPYFADVDFWFLLCSCFHRQQSPRHPEKRIMFSSIASMSFK
jgi:hypothetical protein